MALFVLFIEDSTYAWRKLLLRCSTVSMENISEQGSWCKKQDFEHTSLEKGFARKVEKGTRRGSRERNEKGTRKGSRERTEKGTRKERERVPEKGPRKGEKGQRRNFFQ